MKPQTPKLRAYTDQLSSGKIINDKLRIVERLQSGAQTMETLIVSLGKPHKTVSARISDLADEGLIKYATSPINGRSIFILVTDPSDQVKLCLERFAEKKRQWQKRGQEMGFVD